MKRIFRLVFLAVLIVDASDIQAQEISMSDMNSYEKGSYLLNMAKSQEDPEEAAGLCNLAISEYLSAYAEMDADTLDINIGLSEAYMMVNNISESQECLRSVLDMTVSRYGDKSKEYQTSLLFASMICARAGDDSQSYRLLKHAKRISGNFHGDEDLRNSYLYLRASSDMKCGRNLSAYRMLKRREDDVKRIYGEDSQVYIDHVYSMAQTCGGRRAALPLDKLNNLYEGRILEGFSHLSEAGREKYWKSMSRYYDQILSLVREGDLPEKGYDALLFSKGILLQTSVEFGVHVYSTGDEKAVRDFEHMRSLMSEGAPDHVIDSLDQSIVARLNEIGKEYVPTSDEITWKDVRNALGEDDLAVEFSKTDNGYMAILLRKGWKKPKVVRLHLYNADVSLFARSDSTGYSAESKRREWVQSKAIWTRAIKRSFPRTQYGKIYFSPDAEMCMAGVEYLPISRPAFKKNDLYVPTVADHYKIYRLSSTRLLAADRSVNDSIADPGLYGGMMFDFSRGRILEGKRHAGAGIKYMADTLSERRIQAGYHVGPYDFAPLRASLEEVHGVYDILRKRNLTPSLYTGLYASEDVFKMKSSRSGLLHIATHAFYLSAADAMNSGFYRTMFTANPNSVLDPMNRSGVSFAGANRAWRGIPPPEGFDDGILTSREISLMDLRRSGLVVLSACNTAQGHVSKDGIYGLQRAFKKAGAKTMIISLWQVDDKATQYMMNCFYRNWHIFGMSKYDAFMAAQKQLRNCPGGKYALPYYWKSFILLDPEVK